MEFDIKAMLAEAKVFQNTQPFGIPDTVNFPEFPKALPREHLNSSVALLFVWLLQNDFMETDFSKMQSEVLIAAKTRSLRPIDLLSQIGDRFFPIDIREPQREFLLDYFWRRWSFNLGQDFDRVFVAEYRDALLVPPGYKSTWHVPAEWTQADQFFPVLALRFSQWSGDANLKSGLKT
jgi:hypothetical protein